MVPAQHDPRHLRTDARNGADRAAHYRRRPAGRRRRASRGDPDPRPGAWRHGDQRRAGRGQGRASAAGETCSRHRGKSASGARCAAGERRRAGLRQSAPRSGSVPRSSAGHPAHRVSLTATAPSATARASTSSTSPPIPPARCISAIAAARWSATRWPTCSPRPATTSPRNTTSTMPARRSPRSPGRPIGATCRRSARR